MPFIRKDAWKLGTGWNDTLLWYAKGVQVLQARKIDDPTSWRFLAAMHGFDEELWRSFEYFGSSDTLPSASIQAQFWKQCQHQSWYFLPWHRGYLAAFEAIVRAAITGQNGPSDWALPYWNYNDASNPNAGKPPPAFLSPTLPDGSVNPLHVTRRYGGDGRGNINLDPRQIRLNALLIHQYAGQGSGGSSGFGGPVTTFSHDGDVNGQLENQPHNIVHSLVGGSVRGGNPNNPVSDGLMSMPDTAALDPIFWIHHANIDRLWDVWLRRDSRDQNPTDNAWLTGPADRQFIVPGVDGKPQPYTATDVLSTAAPNLNYTYEDVSDPLNGTDRRKHRLETLGLLSARSSSDTEAGKSRSEMQRRAAAELIGANDTLINLTGEPVETQVRMDPSGTNKVVQSFTTAAATGIAPQEPDRIFLNLENVRGSNDSTVLSIYINLPPGAKPEDHPDHLAGTVSLFGVRKATRKDAAHSGNGITQVIEITDIVDKLHLNSALDIDHLTVRLVPHTDIRSQDGISVGRISVYRQGE